MRISPTIAPISVLARPCAPSALAPSMVPSMALQMWSESVPAMFASVFVYRPWTLEIEGLTVAGDHTGTNDNGTTGSKRPHPGHLDEVST